MPGKIPRGAFLFQADRLGCLIFRLRVEKLNPIYFHVARDFTDCGNGEIVSVFRSLDIPEADTAMFRKFRLRFPYSLPVLPNIVFNVYGDLFGYAFYDFAFQPNVPMLWCF